MSHLMIHTICLSDFDFRLKPLFVSVDMSNFKDGRVHFRNSGMKGLIVNTCRMLFCGVLVLFYFLLCFCLD